MPPQPLSPTRVDSIVQKPSLPPQILQQPNPNSYFVPVPLVQASNNAQSIYNRPEQNPQAAGNTLLHNVAQPAFTGSSFTLPTAQNFYNPNNA